MSARYVRSADRVGAQRQGKPVSAQAHVAQRREAHSVRVPQPGRQLMRGGRA